MAWNKTDNTATASDQPVSSWLANRMVENTDDNTRNALNACTTLNLQPDVWLGSANGMVLPIMIELSPEAEELEVSFPARLAKVTATVDIQVGYGLSNGRQVAFTAPQTVTTTMDQEYTFTVDLSQAHREQLRQLPLLLRFTSSESTDPADQDINGGFDIDGVVGQLVTFPTHTGIVDDTALAGYSAADLFTYYYSGTDKAGKTSDPSWSSPRPQVHFREVSAIDTTAQLHVWPLQDLTPATGFEGLGGPGTAQIHLTLLGRCSISSIRIVQTSPTNNNPYPGVGHTPLGNYGASLQAVAPDLPTRYQTDILPYRAQKYLVANRVPTQSIGPSYAGDFLVPQFNNATVSNFQQTLLIPTDLYPTEIETATGPRKRQAWDISVWMTGWSWVADLNDVEFQLDVSLIEPDPSVFSTPRTRPLWTTLHTQTIPVQPSITSDRTDIRFVAKGLPGFAGTRVVPIGATPIQPLWDSWSQVNANVSKVTFTLRDPVAGNFPDYIFFQLRGFGDNLLAVANKTAVQFIGWTITEAAGEAWDATTEPLP